MNVLNLLILIVLYALVADIIIITMAVGLKIVTLIIERYAEE